MWLIHKSTYTKHKKVLQNEFHEQNFEYNHITESHYWVAFVIFTCSIDCKTDKHDI